MKILYFISNGEDPCPFGKDARELATYELLKESHVISHVTIATMPGLPQPLTRVTLHATGSALSMYAKNEEEELIIHQFRFSMLWF